jgi:hypothetical protein
LHEKEVGGASEDELPSPAVAVDRALYSRQQVWFSLNLIEDDWC